MLITVWIDPTMLTPTRILWCRCHWRWHLLAIQKCLALFQIMFYGTMDLTPLLCVIRAPKRLLLFLIGGLLAVISAISAILVVSSIGHIDFSVVLLLL
jgi:hypothetical protein